MALLDFIFHENKPLNLPLALRCTLASCLVHSCLRVKLTRYQILIHTETAAFRPISVPWRKERQQNYVQL